MKSLFLFSVVCCYVLYSVIRRFLLVYKQYNLLEMVPGPPLKNIILGHPKEAILAPEDLPPVTLKQYKKCGSIWRLWVLPIVGFPIVNIAEAKYAEVFFTAKSCIAKSRSVQFLQVWLGLGLLTSGGQLWQERRKLITPAFHFAILKDYCNIFVRNSLNLIQKLREHPDGTPINVFTLMNLVALDNICESAMGLQINALENPKRGYIQAMKDASHMIMQRIRKPWYWNDLIFFSLPPGRKLKMDLNTIFELTNKAISNRRDEKALKRNADCTMKNDEIGGKKKLALLDLLLGPHESNSASLSDQDLRDEVNTFIFAGHDTVASSMSFTLYLLGLHPEIQEKCYDELCRIFQGSDRKPTAEDLKNMKYLEQVIKESLRLIPTVPQISRTVKEDLKIGDFTIPEGTQLLLSLYCLHRDPNVFPDPEKFDPDRFSSENCASRHPYAYVPFAAGPRNCIGQKYAMMEEKVVLSYILRYFSLESTYSLDELKLVFAVVTRPQKSLDVRFKPRNVQ